MIAAALSAAWDAYVLYFLRPLFYGVLYYPGATLAACAVFLALAVYSESAALAVGRWRRRRRLAAGR